jgi:hypothetical protein
MAFVAAMNAPELQKIGVNGATVLTESGVGDARVTLFTMLTRGLDKDYIEKAVDAVIATGSQCALRDLFVMAFQTRDVRGGKGERELFYEFMRVLARKRPTVAEQMVPLIPTYGCWRDMWVLAERVPTLRGVIFAHVLETFNTDCAAFDAGKYTEMSLLAKWLPREGSKKVSSFFFLTLVRVLCGDVARVPTYRKRVAALNKALKTVEINMCGGSWADIKPDAVPGRCLKLHTKAFLNEKVHGGPYEELRYPDNDDRNACRTHFKDFADGLKNGTRKAKGADTVMPHELVQKLQSHGISDHECEIAQGQWNSIRDAALAAGGLGRVVPMCDFSGSMDGTPMDVSLALGILASEVAHPVFRNHILTFDAKPTWHAFNPTHSLREKIRSTRGVSQGLNTNFYAACKLILKKMVEQKVPVGAEPEDLLVFTDMGWDKAAKTNTWGTQVAQIRQEFADAGGWKAPRIVIWNLRAAYKDFHASANEDGVVMLSGWSPALFKTIQAGPVAVRTPYEGLRAVLDDERYDAVRTAFAKLVAQDRSPAPE